MPVVSIDIRELSGVDPGVDASKASFDFWPYAPIHVVDGGDDYLLNKNILRVRTEDGVAAAFLPETPVGNAMWVQGRGFKGSEKWLIEVPATDFNLWDRPHIDPVTLDPEAPADPAWLAAWAALVTDVATAQDSADAAQVTADAAQVDATAALNGLTGKATVAALNAESTARADADALLQPISTLPAAITAQVGVSYAGPTLPAYAPGTHYVWTKTDAVTGDLIDIITGVAS